ncbi:Fanconi anemia group E protein [Eublepharis macularius]|uniref:Fanconi anemia group E protein n=1 Tax=Eublepharis macularius TaxID=481883 RepID=A0AA97JIE2_EUBMA|nr:Fanconi anemia group E protein [Eublepharis macularius]XP_054837733.1 Fanconi anemia group E protein [Eublepharis macularius]
MDSPSIPWLQRFDKSSRLLLCTLMTGPEAALAAFRTLQRSQSKEDPRQGFDWQDFTEKLCAPEPVLQGPEQTLFLKPLLLLLPVLCQRNLFSLLLMVKSVVPKHLLVRLLETSKQEPSSDLWVQRLKDLLQVELQEKSSLTPVLLTDACQKQLKDLCQKVMAPSSNNPGLERKLSWYIKQTDPCLGMDEIAPASTSQIKKSKKVSEDPISPEEERQRKRARLEVDESDSELFKPHVVQQRSGAIRTGNELMMKTSGNEDVHSETNNIYQNSQKEERVEMRGTTQGSQMDTTAEVPDHVKKHVPKLKELLAMQCDHSDGTAPPELQVLNECTPGQLEGLCSLLQLSECPENELLQFCTWLVALSPDLSYSYATILVGKLFLPRVLALSEPASWPLTMALMMFCSKYARPVCCTLIPSIVQAPGKGLEQMKLVCKIIEECLEPEYVRLVFSQTVEMSWSEELLAVVHSLLERQVELSAELFNLLVSNVCQMAQEFSRSMHYAKLVLTLLTKYQSSITSAHQYRLSGVLDLNETILKKSLQIALKRVTSR